MAKAPKCSDHGRPHAVALIADDGRDGNHVIRIRGVAHPQKKSHCEDGEKPNHALHLTRPLRGTTLSGKPRKTPPCGRRFSWHIRATKPVGDVHAGIRGNAHTYHLIHGISWNQSIRPKTHFPGSVYRGHGEVLRGLPRPATGNHHVYADV